MRMTCVLAPSIQRELMVLTGDQNNEKAGMPWQRCNRRTTIQFLKKM